MNLFNNEILNIGLLIISISFLLLIIIGNINGNNSIINNKEIVSLAPLNIRKLTLFISVLTLYIVLIWWYIGTGDNWNNDNGEFIEISNVYGHILGIDSLSGWYLLLVGIILPITILSAWQFRTKESKLYYYTLLGLGLALLVNYLSGELISFYVLFECTLIPLFILIGLYGSSNREQAAYYILLYTLISSLFMLCSMILTKEFVGLTLFTQVPVVILSIDLQLLLWFGIFLAIMVKSPLYPLHTWLPVVHSESPLGGSILLAALVLKLTVYLILRWLLPAFPEASLIYTPLVYTICIITIIIVSLITIIQTDLKVVVAYSSVSHKNFGSLQNIIYYNYLIFVMQHTVCRKLIKLFFSLFLLSTNNIYNYLYISVIQLKFLLVKILINYMSNPQIIKALSMLVRISEAICVLLYFNNIFHLFNIRFLRNYSINSTDRINMEIRFNEWLAGVIDGDGHIYVRTHSPTKCSLSITMDLRDEKTLYLIKQRLGGKVKLINGKKAFRYSLHHYDGIIDLANRINGLIRTPRRIEQFKKLCNLYDINYIYPVKLTYESGWLSGFLDSDGTVTLNKANNTISIVLVQKDKSVLDELVNIYPGNVQIHVKGNHRINQSYRFVITREYALYDMLDNYFRLNPSRTVKLSRLCLIKKFFELKQLKAYKAEEGSNLNKIWIDFLEKWNKYY